MNVKTRTTLRIPLALTLVATLGAAYTPGATADEIIIKEKKTVSLGGDLFSINANADKMTAEERVSKVNDNLNRALLYSASRTPEAVQIRIKNRLPVVELNGYHIVTADSNSARRNNMTRMELARMWADTLRQALEDRTTVTEYISSLIKAEPPAKAKVLQDKCVAMIQPEMKIPIKLVSGFYMNGASTGDSVTAVVSRDVPLGNTFEAYIPKGTLVNGQVVEGSLYAYNNYPADDAVTIDFTSMKLPDGQEIPINAHIFGKTNQYFEYDSKQVPGTSEITQYQPPEAENRLLTETPQATPQGVIDPHRGDRTAVRGLITGAWLGQAMSKSEQHLHTARLFMRKGSVFQMSPDTELQLETHGPTSIAIAVPAGSTM
ncbi:MAG: hypothetical protein AB7W16_17575 [Candidatus Obscuribacterales bacterium]